MILTKTKTPKHQLPTPRTSCSNNNNNNNNNNKSSEQYHDWYVPAALSTYSSVSIASSSTKNTAPDGRSTRAAVSAMMTTWGCLKTVLETVYRCDSAAVVAVRETASSCGSVAHEALYQGVEVIYTTTTSNPCHTTTTHTTNSSSSSSSSRIGDNSNATTNSAMQTPTTETPFMVYQCFCDDDDFIIAHTTPSKLVDDNDDEDDGDDDSRNPTSSLLNEDFCDDDDNRRSRCADDEIEKETSGVRQDDPPALVAARWKTHTKDFYAKIYAPTTQRVRTRLHDVDLPSSSLSPTKSTTTISTKAATAQHSAFAFFRFLEINNATNNKTTAADEETVITDRSESCSYLMA